MPDTRILINPRDWTALVPDGPVNRHTPVTLFADEDGLVHVDVQIEHAREQAKDAGGRLPEEQLIGSQDTDPGELDDLRNQVRELREALAQRDAARTDQSTQGGGN